MPTRPAATFAVLLAAAVAGGPACRREVAPPPPVGADGAPRLITTDGALAAGNLEAELVQAENQHRERPTDVARSRALVERLLMRAQFLGRLADYDRAEVVARASLVLAPRNAEAHLLVARVAAALHEFPSALAQLDEADLRAGKREAVADQVLRARVGIWQATGRVDEALPYLQRWRRDRPDLVTYGAEACAYADKRDVTRAATMFALARSHHRDVSPFPVAWLEVQEGHLWESAGRSDRARPLFESAHARLPAYAAASAHLASTVAAFGDPEGLRQAAELLRPLVASGDDPEPVGQLASITRQLGRLEDADVLMRRATAMYDALLRRHPAAFADHAARFFFHVAGDPRRALALAEQNLTLRPTADARDLRDAIQASLTPEARAPN